MQRFSVVTSEPLRGDINLAERLAHTPHDYVMKGMFFKSIVPQLGATWDHERQTLLAPPRLGRYIPFADYPQRDYSQLVGAMLRVRYPRMESREASRQYARREFEVFGASAVGNIISSLVGDPMAALLRFPDMIRTVMKGGEVFAREEAGAVVLRFERFHGWLDSHFIGVVEGIVQQFGASPSIDVEIAAPTEGTYRVTWR